MAKQKEYVIIKGIMPFIFVYRVIMWINMC